MNKNDEIIESFEHVDKPIYGVQFHPERMCLNNIREDTVDGEKLLKFFYYKCLEYKKHEVKDSEN